MSERIERRRFHAIDWRVVRDAASTHFRTGSFAAGVALVYVIGTLADAANHHPHVDHRYRGDHQKLQSPLHEPTGSANASTQRSQRP